MLSKTSHRYEKYAVISLMLKHNWYFPARLQKYILETLMLESILHYLHGNTNIQNTTQTYHPFKFLR